jgi:polysaccharide pyruvyl transferase CsaB
MKRMVIAGNFGFHNIGDEAILSSIISNFRKNEMDMEYCVVSGDPDQTKGSLQVDSVFWKDIPAIIDAAKKCDLIILGGGGIFNDYWGVQVGKILTEDHAGLSYYSEFALLADMLHKPLFIYAAGIGPLATKEGRDLTRLTFELATRATLRDIESKKLLLELGCESEKLSVVSDPAFCLDSDYEKAKIVFSGLPLDDRKPNVAICLRNWNVNCIQEDWQKAIADGLDRLVESHPCNLIFIPFHNLPDYELTDDISAAEKVISHMKYREDNYLIRGVNSPQTVAGIISQCRLVIGMRLHSIILAANGSIPVVGIAYDPKVEQMMKRLGLDAFSINLMKLNSDDLYSVVEKCWREHDQIQSLVRNKSKKLKSIALHDSITTLNLMKKVGQEKVFSLADEYLRRLVLNQSQLLFESKRVETKLKGDLSEREKELFEFSILLKKNTRDLQSLNTKIEKKNEIIQKMTSTNKTVNEKLLREQVKIQALEKKEIENRKEIQGLIDHLDEISRSRGWKLLQGLWSLRLFLIPLGSKREKIIKALWHGVHTPFRIARQKKEFKPPTIFRDGYIEQDNSFVTLYTDKVNSFPDYSPRMPVETDKPDNLKVSLIVSEKNEIKSIEAWLQDIKGQTRPPDEIIIVDGGSIDGSYELLISKVDRFPIPLKVILGTSANRSAGRNIAVSNSRFPLIAVTDFGCRIPPDWLDKLTRPFIIDPETRVSAGFYRCLEKKGNLISKNELWANPHNTHPQSFLPSSRSIAFSKKVFDEVGGYPEWLQRTGEDTFLDLELKRAGGKWAFVPEAIVYWQAPKQLLSFIRKNFEWAAGDGESGVHARYYWRYVVHLIEWLTFFMGILAILAFIFLVPLKPATLWAVFTAAVFFAVLWITARNAELSQMGLIQKMFGEVVQIFGFIKGVGRRKEVTKLRYATVKGIIFLLAGVPMDDTGGGSRGAQIAGELLTQGYVVIYINRFLSYESKVLDHRTVHPNLFKIPLSAFDWETFCKENPELMNTKSIRAILEFPLPEFLELQNKIKAKGGKILYDLIDDWQSSLGSDWYSAEVEKKIIAGSHVLTATTPLLCERLENIYHRSAIHLPNAVNGRLFNYTSQYDYPFDFPRQKRIIIYTGALWGDWFDWDLLGEMADDHSDDVICMIGDYRGQMKNPPPNLRFLGLQPQNVLPAYLAYSDVAIIPWKVSRITQATSPLKLYEYLAMGCPVIAPDLEPLHGIPGVFLAKSKDDFIELVGKVNRTKLHKEQVILFIKENNWSARVRQMLASFDNEI